MPKNNHYTLSFEDARKIVRSYGFKTHPEYTRFMNSNKRPINLPKSPHYIYKDKWISWPDFLGIGTIEKPLQRNKTGKYRIRGTAKTFLPYEKAKEIIQSYKFKSHDEYRLWSKTKRPKNIPGQPADFYKGQFEGWDIYFGKHQDAIAQQMPDLFVENAEKEISQKPVDEPIVLPQLRKLHSISKIVEHMEEQKRAEEIHQKYEWLAQRLKMFDELAKTNVDRWRNEFVNFLVKSKFADECATWDMAKMNAQAVVDALAKNPVTETMLTSFATERDRKFFCNPQFDDDVWESLTVEHTVEMLTGRGWRWVDYYEGRIAMVSELLGLQMDIHEKQSEEGDYMIVDRIEFHLCNVPLQ